MESPLPQIEKSNDLFEVIIDSAHLSINKKRIGLTLGYRNMRIPEYFDGIINDIIAQVPGLCEIKAGYRILHVQKPYERPDGLYINDKFFKTEKIINSQLNSLEKAALFVCTIGPGMETWAGQLFRDSNAVKGNFVDTISSEAVESATDLLHNHIKLQMMERGLKITNRFSPGYCGWSLSEQHLLFSFFPANFCGITLTQSALMIPVKSVSGIIGIGKGVKLEDYQCNKCERKDCPYRKRDINKTEYKKRLE